MGVDLETYRGRIGTFRHSQGLDVVTIVCVINFSRGMKSVGTVVFIGVLLLIAGIESNPGPTILDLCTCSSPKTKIKVTGLPEHVDEEGLENFFENKRKQGGGFVKQVQVFEDQRIAIIEFEESEAVEKVLEKRPIIFKKTEVNVHLFHSSDTVEVTGIPKDVSVKTLEDYFKTQTSDETSFTCIVREENIAFVTFENEQITKQIGFIDRHTLENYQQPIVVKFHDPELSRLHTAAISATWSSDPDFESTVLQSQDTGLQTSDEKKLHFKHLLERMGLSSRVDKLITVREVLSVHINLAGTQDVGDTNYAWAFLQKICTSNYKAMDMNFALSDLEQSSNTRSPLENLDILSEEEISPLDLFLVIYSCCDPMLKQLIFKNFYLCKLAVPFITDRLCSSVPSPLVSVWPLRPLLLEGKMTRDGDNSSSTQFEVLDFQSTMVTFARLGRPSFSKSKVLNFLLHKDAYNTFYNCECISGTAKRTVSDGYVEIFWLPTVKDDKDSISSPLTFLNVRGDLRMYFCENVLPFLHKITDIFVMIIEIQYLLQNVNEVQNIVKNYRFVLLLICGPLDSKDAQKVNSLKKFNACLRDKYPNMHYKIVLTHKNVLPKNMLEIAKVVSNAIEDFQKGIAKETLEHRLSFLENDNVKIDETEEACVEGKRLAKDIIESMGTQQDAPLQWKMKVTPAHSLYSRYLGDKIKKIRREQDTTQIEFLRQEVKNLRVHQIESITTTIRLFAGHLVSKAKSPSCLRYFLAWLSIFIQVEKQKVLPKLINDNRTAWAKMGNIKSQINSNSEDIELQRECIKKTENKIEEASFSIELLFREIGQIYDTIIILDKDSTCLELPSIEDMEDVCASLFVEGNTLELIDGEAFYMPEHWIGGVFKKVSKIIGTQKVLTVSILGIQSSGKSTLLNTVFGSQFPTSAGRCTRGIQMKLFPLHINNPFQYLLILDTEGLRAPDVSDGKYDHDNQLATIITGLGDITVMNVMGENALAIRDILQVVVHAFLRLKIADSKIDLRRRCAFIHHNVSSVMALDKMRPSISKLIEILDSVTKDAAETEGISDIVEFNQIIKFDMTSQVWFLPNLWEGCPPISRINSEYSSQAADIKDKLLQLAISDAEKSYGSLNDVIVHTRDLWKGVLTEDFVFYFRNSEEIRAFNFLESKVLHWMSDIQCFFHEKCIKTSLKEFAKCLEQCDLEEAMKTANELIFDHLQNRISEIKEKIEIFFNNNEFKNSMRPWKRATITRFEFTCNELFGNVKKETEKFRLKRSIEIFQTFNRFEHEDKLHKKSMNLAKSAKHMTVEEINNQFETIWQKFVEEIKNVSQVPTSAIFKTRLREIYACDEWSLDMISRQMLLYFGSVSASISLSDLLSDELNFYFKKTVQVINALTYIESLIQNYVTYPYIIDKEKIVSFLDDVQKEIECESWKNERLRMEIKLEILVKVCCYSSSLFDKHNLDPRTQHSIILKKDVHNYLYQFFASDQPIVRQEINQTKVFVKRLSFNNIQVSATDISIPRPFFSVHKVSDKEKLALVRPHIETILSKTDDDINAMCFTDTEMSESNIKPVLYNVKKSIEDLKKHKNEFTLTKKFTIRICVYVVEYAYAKFQKHNTLHHENIANRLNKYKKSVRARFDAHLSDRKQEDTAALLLSNEIEAIAREDIKFHMPGKILNELLKTMPSTKVDLITDMLTDMAEAGRFLPFIEYIECPTLWAELWIQDKSEKYLFARNAENITIYSNIASQHVSQIFEDIYSAIAATTKRFIMCNPPTLEAWIEQLNKSLKHCQIGNERIRNVRREIANIQDVNNFKTSVLVYLKELENDLKSEAAKETEVTVRWAASDPYKDIFKMYWGCKEKCAYCGEPCIKNDNHDTNIDKHKCIQHRPICCSGSFDRDSKKASTETCNFNVQHPDKRHNCFTFQFACRRSEGKPCKKNTMHLFKDYQNYLPNWDIEPDSDMLESSEFWMWFVAIYKTELADYYGYDVSEIPKSWHDISIESALKSLRRKYGSIS